MKGPLRKRPLRHLIEAIEARALADVFPLVETLVNASVQLPVDP